MAEGEEDFSSLPLPDRFSHKVNAPLPDVFGQITSMTRKTLTMFRMSLELESEKGRLRRCQATV